MDSIEAQLKKMAKDEVQASTPYAQTLLKVLKNLQEVFESVKEKEAYDAGLGAKIEKGMSAIAEAFAKIKSPIVTVTPNISVDLKPVADEISKGQSSLIAAIGKLNTDGKSTELYNLVVSMVAKQNSFIESGLKQNDYTQQLKLIGEGLNKKQTEWEFTVTRGGYQGTGNITKITATPKK